MLSVGSVVKSEFFETAVAPGAARRQNRAVRIDIRNLRREPLFSVQVDPKDPSTVVRPSDGENAGSRAGRGGPGLPEVSGVSGAPEVYLHWDQAFDDQHFLRHCPVCGCRELFVRKDFPQVTGFVIVVLAAVLSMVLFGLQHVVAAVVVLITVTLMDLLIYFSPASVWSATAAAASSAIFPIRPEQRGWELAVGGEVPRPVVHGNHRRIGGRGTAVAPGSFGNAGATLVRKTASKKIVIYGGGGHGLVVAEAAEAAGWTVVGFFDDELREGQRVGRWKIVTQVGLAAGVGVIVGIGDNATRGRIFRGVVRDGRRLDTIIHPTAWVSPSAMIGRGVYIGPHAVVNARARIADGAIVNSAAVVEHDCHIGEHAHVAPNAALGGGVAVGEYTLIGIGATVRPAVRVGDKCDPPPRPRPPPPRMPDDALVTDSYRRTNRRTDPDQRVFTDRNTPARTPRWVRRARARRLWQSCSTTAAELTIAPVSNPGAGIHDGVRPRCRRRGQSSRTG